MSDLSKRLEEIEARAAACPEGPWIGACSVAYTADGGMYDATAINAKGNGNVTVCVVDDEGREAESVVAFIAHARADVPALLAALRVAMEQRDEFLDHIHACDEISADSRNTWADDGDDDILAALEGRG